MCEYCDHLRAHTEPKPLRATLRPSATTVPPWIRYPATPISPTPVPQKEEEDLEEMEENLTQAGRDLLGMLRIGCKMGDAGRISQPYIQIFASLIGVETGEQDIIFKIIQPLREASKNISTEEAIAHLLTQKLA